MPRGKLRSQRDVVERCRALADDVRAALARLPEAEDDAEVVDAVWRGEALGTLLWALGLVELPPYDEAFDPAAVVEVDPAAGKLREPEEVERALESARLWHWRARTTALGDDPSVLPERWESFDQLVAAAAMRGYEDGLLPAPMRGDFNAFGKVYRHLSADQHSEATSIALERHHALAWLCGLGDSWDSVPLDT